MKKFKRLIALAAVSMLGIQLMGIGTASAAGTECDFGNDSLDITIDTNDVAILVDEFGMLQCDDNYDGSFSGVADPVAASAVDSITVEMDDDTSDGQLVILLDGDTTGSDDPASEWPTFDTFDINVSTRLVFDGSGVDGGAANGLTVTIGKSTFSFSGTSGTFTASGVEFADGGDDDIFDASKATVRVYSNITTPAFAGAEAGDDVFKGGSANDRFDLASNNDDVVVYGNGGNDFIATGGGDDQGWGGDGDDDIDLGGAGADDDIAAPGAGDDDVADAETVSYADLKDGVEITLGETAGAGGDDSLAGYVALVGSAGDDVIVDFAYVIKGGAGDDVIKCAGCNEDNDGYAAGGEGDDFLSELFSTGYIDVLDTLCSDSNNSYCGERNDYLYGNAGNDVLKGKLGEDTLRGGPGSDQAWGGPQADTCTAEVRNRCEYIKN